MWSVTDRLSTQAELPAGAGQASGRLEAQKLNTKEPPSQLLGWEQAARNPTNGHQESEDAIAQLWAMDQRELGAVPSDILISAPPLAIHVNGLWGTLLVTHRCPGIWTTPDLVFLKGYG